MINGLSSLQVILNGRVADDELAYLITKKTLWAIASHTYKRDGNTYIPNEFSVNTKLFDRQYTVNIDNDNGLIKLNVDVETVFKQDGLASKDMVTDTISLEAYTTELYSDLEDVIGYILE